MPHEQGEKRPGSKLTPSAVVLIRTSPLSLGAIAKALNISKTTAWRVKQGTDWRHIPGPTREQTP